MKANNLTKEQVLSGVDQLCQMKQALRSIRPTQNQKIKESLIEMGYKEFDNEQKFRKEFSELGKEIILRIEDNIKPIMPQSYKGEYCGVYDHYSGQMAQIYAGDGICHASFTNDKGTKYCVSPFGYVFERYVKFGRILKDGSIKKGTSGRYGNLKYD